MRDKLEKRLAECKLEISPGKTKVVYCKDRERTETYPEINFDFLGYTFRPRKSVSKEGKLSVNFLPAMSARAAKATRQTVRGWDLSHKTPLSLEVMAHWLNPMLRGWVKYYGRFYRSAMDCIASHISWERRGEVPLRDPITPISENSVFFFSDYRSYQNIY
ncbi:group II intron maturase-specific domain-containing protein [Xenorhabdus siamensis]|uniref:group II intron maturase-specific domain-containing protein n=1 Tax=Xenorhabdus siamensis TaxID=3136254 RepID=UPI0030F40235